MENFREIYKYSLTDVVIFHDKIYVVVGRSDFLHEVQNKYLIQDFDKYGKNGIDYYCCMWADENKITLRNETNTENTITDSVRD